MICALFLNQHGLYSVNVFPAHTCPHSFFSLFFFFPCGANDVWIGDLCRGYSEGPQQLCVFVTENCTFVLLFSLYTYPLPELQQMDTQSPSCAAFHTNCAKLCVCVCVWGAYNEKATHESTHAQCHSQFHKLNTFKHTCTHQNRQ